MRVPDDAKAVIKAGIRDAVGDSQLFELVRSHANGGVDRHRLIRAWIEVTRWEMQRDPLADGDALSETTECVSDDEPTSVGAGATAPQGHPGAGTREAAGCPYQDRSPRAPRRESPADVATGVVGPTESAFSPTATTRPSTDPMGPSHDTGWIPADPRVATRRVQLQMAGNARAAAGRQPQAADNACGGGAGRLCGAKRSWEDDRPAADWACSTFRRCFDRTNRHRRHGHGL